MLKGNVVILGLGSNVGNRRDMLATATGLLQGFLENSVFSSLYESDALLLEDSPPEWNIPFLNMAVKAFTTLSPVVLLTHIKALEQQLGRQERGRWSPREIDIDILAYGEEVVHSDILQIPHQGLLERPFALIPFAEIYPEWQYPVVGEYYGKTASALRALFFENTREIQKLPLAAMQLY